MKDMGMRMVQGDEAFYYKNEGGKLKGAVLSHVDDFNVPGDTGSVDEMVARVKGKFTVSRMEENTFRFTGLDVENKDGKIQVLMEDYAKLLEEVTEIRRAQKDEKLTRLEIKNQEVQREDIMVSARGTTRFELHGIAVGKEE